jgi:putative PIN family toxin of toxin-antitoxin system
MPIVLDTNVLVSALLKQDSLPAQAVRLIISRRMRLAIDERIWREYEAVTARPHLKIHSATRWIVLTALAAVSQSVNAVRLDISAEEIPDPSDLPFAEVAVAAKADALVTGNIKHFAFLAEYGVKALTPLPVSLRAKRSSLRPHLGDCFAKACPEPVEGNGSQRHRFCTIRLM